MPIRSLVPNENYETGLTGNWCTVISVFLEVGGHVQGKRRLQVLGPSYRAVFDANIQPVDRGTQVQNML